MEQRRAWWRFRLSTLLWLLTTLALSLALWRTHIASLKVTRRLEWITPVVRIIEPSSGRIDIGAGSIGVTGRYDPGQAADTRVHTARAALLRSDDGATVEVVTADMNVRITGERRWSFAGNFLGTEAIRRGSPRPPSRVLRP